MDALYRLSYRGRQQGLLYLFYEKISSLYARHNIYIVYKKSLVDLHGYVSIRGGRGKMGEKLADMLPLLAPENDKLARLGFHSSIVHNLSCAGELVIANRAQRVWWVSITRDSLIIGARSIWDRCDAS